MRWNSDWHIWMTLWWVLIILVLALVVWFVLSVIRRRGPGAQK